jgi:hypothetical protein
MTSWPSLTALRKRWMNESTAAGAACQAGPA